MPGQRQGSDTQPQPGQFAEPLWTDPGLKNEISVLELIFNNNNKKAQVGNEWSNILPDSSRMGGGGSHCFFVHRP